MPFQMALDEVLFSRCGKNGRKRESNETPPLLRFYVSSEPWITVGYSSAKAIGDSTTGAIPTVLKVQPPWGRNRFLSPTGLASPRVCSRITGGGEVLHDEDLIFSLIAHKNHDESFKSVRMSYWKIHEAVKEAFWLLGIEPRFFRCDEKLPRGKTCFEFPIATDLALGDEKIAGGAQKRSSGWFLHQESIKIPKGIDRDDLMAAIRRSFEKVFDIRVAEEDLNPEWLREADELSKQKVFKSL